MRNRQMVVRWLIDHTTAVEVRQRDGKTYYVVTDAARVPRRGRRASRRGPADQVRGRLPGRATHLFETYGIHFDPALRDEVVARVAKLDLPSYTGFVMPRLEAVKGADGEIRDIRISYPLDLTRQMLEYAEMGRSRP